MNVHDNTLRFNVGFIIGEANGYSREFPVNQHELQLDTDVYLNCLEGSIVVTRTSAGLLVKAKLSAIQPNICGRCLMEFNQEMKIQLAELFNFPSHVQQENDLIVPPTGYLDLSSLVCEYVLLETPMNPICAKDCKGLCSVCGENLNNTSCKHDGEEIDERLQVLAQWNDEQ